MCSGTISRAGHSHHYSPIERGISSQNINRGAHSASTDESNGCERSGGLNLSREAQVMMSMVGLMAAMMGGDFGALMTMLSGPMGAQRGYGQVPDQGGPCQAMSAGHPGFGEVGANRGGPNRSEGVESNAPKVGAGQTKELKEGESVRGANGTQLTWGAGDNVDIKYKAKNGQMKTISVKDGMISFDGGTPQKLENTGQMLKLPNGDVVGIGNQNDNKGGKDMCRVVMADSTDKVASHPPQATNIYDVEQLERKYTSREGGGISMNVTSGSFHTPYGDANFTSINANVFLGHLVERSHIEQQLNFNSVK